MDVVVTVEHEPSLPRDVNRRLHTLTSLFAGLQDYLCECGRETCYSTMIALPARDADDIFRSRGLLVVAPGHEPPGAEIVRQRHDHLIVRGVEATPSPATP